MCRLNHAEVSPPPYPPPPRRRGRRGGGNFPPPFTRGEGFGRGDLNPPRCYVGAGLFVRVSGTRRSVRFRKPSVVYETEQGIPEIERPRLVDNKKTRRAVKLSGVCKIYFCPDGKKFMVWRAICLSVLVVFTNPYPNRQT